MNLVERLKMYSADPVLGGVSEEAADRIEQLEAELLEINNEATILERIGEPVAWSHNNGHIQCDGVGVPSHLYTVENGWTPLFAIKGVE